MKRASSFVLTLLAVIGSTGCISGGGGPEPQVRLTDAEIENIVRRSYQYVALFNVTQKGAIDENSPVSTGGFNKLWVATQLYDHNVKIIARPNNDTLYISCAMDLRKDPVILDVPVFDSQYASLMTFSYDHYVGVPLSTRTGDFQKPERLLFYSARTEGYWGQPVDGVDRVLEMTGDFVGGLFRVMPHANEPERFAKIVEAMNSVRMQTLSEYRGGTAKPTDDVTFPAFGETDQDVFGNNFVEVMQFVANHLTFDPEDELDQGVLAAWELIGVRPGRRYDAATAMQIDSERFRAAAASVQKHYLGLLTDEKMLAEMAPVIFRPKGEKPLEALIAVSVVGPIGLPKVEATYPGVRTADGSVMNARYDYVIRMTKDELPPAKAFWSVTLYDRQNGFFVPNDRKKYSVGQNAGMEFDENGGIEIHIAAKRPEGVPEENWLPITREDLDLDVILRVYVPDLERLGSWSAPKAERLDAR